MHVHVCTHRSSMAEGTFKWIISQQQQLAHNSNITCSSSKKCLFGHTATKVQQHVGVGYIIRTAYTLLHMEYIVYMEQCHDSREIAVKYILHTT